MREMGMGREGEADYHTVCATDLDVETPSDVKPRVLFV